MKSRERIVDTLPWHDTALLKGSGEEEYEPLSESEREIQDSDEHWLRIDAEVRHFGGMR